MASNDKPSNVTQLHTEAEQSELAPAAAAETARPDTKDFSSLWIDPGLGDVLARPNVLSIEVGKPKDFFRVCPSLAYRRTAEVLVYKKDGIIETPIYLVDKSMSGLIDKARKLVIVTTIYRDGTVRLWPIPSPNPGEKDNAAWSTARMAAKLAMDHWVSLVWKARSYATRQALEGYAPEPDWNAVPPYEDLIALGFGNDGIIRNKSHHIYTEQIGAPSKSDDDVGDL
jgi:hypothetical protein